MIVYNTSTIDASEEELKTSISRAIDLFKKRDFTSSLSLYDTIVSQLCALSEAFCTRLRNYYNLRPQPLAGKLCHPKLPNVLDQRAATKEKLGLLEEALEDAKMIVVLDPLECKGYLRKGKLLVAMGERVKAYKCYQEGVYLVEKAQKDEDVTVNRKIFCQLRSAFTELNEELKKERKALIKAPNPACSNSKSMSTIAGESAGTGSSSHTAHQRETTKSQSSIDDIIPIKQKSVQDLRMVKKARSSKDLMERLPLEVINEIYSQLDVKQISNSLRVSKLWYNTLTKIPSLFLNSIVFKNKITYAEFSNFMLFLKKVLTQTSSRCIPRLVIPTTFRETDLRKILQDLLQSDLQIESLGIRSEDFSVLLLLSTLSETNFSGFEKLKVLKSLQMTHNTDLFLDFMLLDVCPNLKNLEILIADVVRKISTEDSDKNKAARLRFESALRKYRKIPEDSDERLYPVRRTHGSLSSLVLVNKRVPSRFGGTFSDQDGFWKVSPPMTRMVLPNLSSLTIASFNIPSMYDVVSNKSNLKSLNLDSNTGLPFDMFLRNLSRGNVSFKLRSFTFREISGQWPLNLDGINLDCLKCLSELRYLDLYGCSLYNKALLNILRLGTNIHTLNIGNSKYVYFKNSQFARNNPITWTDFFESLPHLKALYMPDMDFDHLTLTEFNKAAAEVYGAENLNLDLLDLSFCHKVDGLALLYLFESTMSINNGSFPKVKRLVLNGLTIAKDTLSLLVRKKYILEVENDPFKKAWLTPGVNSYVLNS